MELKNRFLPKDGCGRMDLNGPRTIPGFMRGRRTRLIRSFSPRRSFNFIFMISLRERAYKFRWIGKTGSGRIWRRRRMGLWWGWRRDLAMKWGATGGQKRGMRGSGNGRESKERTQEK